MATEKAKNRVIDVGARFSNFELENARDRIATSEKITPAANHGGKPSFWKKGTSKLPGRPIYGAQHPPLQTPDSVVIEAFSKNAKANKGKKHQITFQEFQGSTSDAWDETEDDIIRVSDDAGMSVSPPADVVTFHGSDVRERIMGGSTAGESSAVATSEFNVSHECESQNRQPQAKNQTHTETKTQRGKASVKETIVSKLSETLSKTRSRMSPSPPHGVDVVRAPSPPTPIHQTSVDVNEHENVRLEKFGKLLAGPTTDLEQLRKLSWNGIPPAVRAATWQLLSGYVPPAIDRRSETLQRKRNEYFNFVEKYYPTRFEDAYNEDTYRQIHIDIPRTNPLIPIFQQQVVQELFERILYIWAIRHPASGYVQGINDLVVPFFIVFVSEHTAGDVEEQEITDVNKDLLDEVEADTFWCVSKLLDGIQDNYTFAQPGIQMKVHGLQDLVDRIDRPLNAFIASHKIDYLQFTFRWMNNLLMRELPLWCTIRLWDTYWAEPDGFALFHFYVCAALLTQFSKQIMRHTDFQGLMVFLQNLPTRNWNDEDVSMLVAEAYRLKFMFADAPKHLKTGQ